MSGAGTEAATACPQCGEKITPSDQFCESCGTQLRAKIETARTEDGELGTQVIEAPGADVAAVDMSVATEPVPATTRLCSCGGAIDADGYCGTCGLRAPTERDHFSEQPAPLVAGVCDRGIQHRRNEDHAAQDDPVGGLPGEQPPQPPHRATTCGTPRRRDSRRSTSSSVPAPRQAVRRPGKRRHVRQLADVLHVDAQVHEAAAVAA